MDLTPPAIGRTVFITGKSSNTQLAARPEGQVYMSTNKLAWERWLIERGGGRQHFHRSAHGTAVSCDAEGKLSMTQNRGANERWRMYVAASGYTFITSLATGRYLCVGPDGALFTTTVSLNCEQWTVRNVS